MPGPSNSHRLSPARGGARAWLPAVGVMLAVAFAAPPAQADLSAKVLTALESDSVRIRVTAVVAVGKSNDPLARRILEGMLRDDAAAVRAAACEGLEAVADPRSAPALKKALNDKDPLVKKVAARALAALDGKGAPDAPKAVAVARPAGPSVTIEVNDSRDMTGRGFKNLDALLLTEVKGALNASKKRRFDVVDKGAQSGFAMLLRVRSIKNEKQGAANVVFVKCEMTLLKMPSRALRLASSATAGMGLEGALSPALEVELVNDAIKACAPELVNDVVDYVLQRGG